MTSQAAQPLSNDIVMLTDLVYSLRSRVDELGRNVENLEYMYREAGTNLRLVVADDVEHIKNAKIEVSKIAEVLRGVELFGRYAHDADNHAAIANRWRRAAVGVLVISPAVVVATSAIFKQPASVIALALGPILALFIYCSVESYNHRRREFDRRRIALRVSAIESFTKARRDGAEEKSRRVAEELLDDFVRMHFIEPSLDSNDMDYIAPRTGIVRVMRRDGNRPERLEGKGSAENSEE